MPAYRPVDPKQSFPELEERILARWQAGDVFVRSLSHREDAETWVFNEGPPTANGKPGSHHVFARVFKDIYPRYQTMRGRQVPRKGGWDCHGLPVELEVERRLGIKSKAEIEDFGIAEFNQLCRESVFEYVDDWNRLTERVGSWMDLDNAYFTLNNDYIESVWWSLKTVFDKELLYRGHRVVPYCPRCGTSLSSHEVAQGYQDVEDQTVYVKLKLADADEHLLIWTTTPWTLPGNVAVAAGPDITYARVKTGEGEIVIVAKDLVEKVVGEGAEIISTLPGSELIGRSYEGPVFRLTEEPANAFRVLAGDFVTTTDGTGLVHLAPAFGEDDYRVAAENGIFDPTDAATLFNPVTLEGNFDNRVTGFEGKFVKNPAVTEGLIEDLESRGLVFRRETYEHSYPHCWRCGTPLLYYAKSSWYVKTTAVRDTMLAENEKIGWQPEHIKHGRFGKWLENNQDWAISRERYWGTPLPVWECSGDDCDRLVCVGSMADIEANGGTVPDDLHRPYIDDVTLDCPDCGGEMRRVKETVDAWWDSGSMPFAQYHYPFENQDLFDSRFPADFISEGLDQTRGWFYSLLAVSTLLFGETAYRNCVCLGLILDPEGQKMSKSRGNVVDPWNVIESHGADAFRWYYFTAQQPWAGYRFSVETLGETVNSFFTTLWNTYSFWVMYANAEGLDAGDPLGPPAPGEGSRLDDWAMSRLQTLTSAVIGHMDNYDCTQAGREIATFIDELSNWYVRLNRRRFWSGDRAALGTLRHCLVEVSKLLAPFTPYLADDIYINLSGDAIDDDGVGLASVHLADFPVPDTTLTNLSLERDMEAVRRTVELGRAARAQAKVKMRQPLGRAVIVAEGDEKAAIEAMGDTVRAELNVKDLEFVSTDAELASYEVKPNYRKLGPRFGKNMPQVAAAVAALDPEHAAAAARGEKTVGISIDGTDHDLGIDDLLLTLKPLEGYEVEASAGRAVALATDLTDELLREGVAREIVHAVQNARKAAGLEITDRIALTLDGSDDLLAAAREHEIYISGEVLALELGYGDIEGGAEATEAKIEGETLTIGVERRAHQ